MAWIVVQGLLAVLAISMVPVVLVWLAIRLPTFWENSGIFARRHGLVRKPPPEPTGPPLEKLAADLRRLRPEVHSPRHGIPMAKHLATVGVYDSRLVATAQALDVPTPLEELPPGMEREAERMRLEHALEQAGLSWEVHPA